MIEFDRPYQGELIIVPPWVIIEGLPPYMDTHLLMTREAEKNN